MRLIIFILSFLLVAACAPIEERVTDVGTMLAPVDERTIHGDTHFTPRERAAAQYACIAWQQFTRGRVRLSVVWDVDDYNYASPPSPTLYRVNNTAPTGHFGGRTDADRIWWVPGNCDSPYLEACIMHEYGHMLGLQHFESIPGQVMSAHRPVPRFGLYDNGECERVGVCRDRTLDVTTVTVTIDPSIPNVEPSYP